MASFAPGGDVVSVGAAAVVSRGATVSGNAVPPRTGNRHGGLAESPYNVYPTSDGHIAIICVNETHWQSLLTAMQRDDLRSDPRYLDLKHRVEHMDEIDEIVSAFTSRHTKQALFDLLMKHRVPCAPVRNLDEVVNDPHTRAREMVVEMEHPEAGTVYGLGIPIKLSATPGSIRRPAPLLGQHNDEILAELKGPDPLETR